jgi:anti-sigma regulatory factor (Ser/Thr protein kinase)
VERLGLWPTVANEVPSGEALLSKIRRVTKESAPELRDDAAAVILVLSGAEPQQLRLSARPDAIASAVRWVLDQCPDWVDQSGVDHGLTEALTNAILHGTLNMRSAMREGEDGYTDYLTLAEQLPDRPGYADRCVELSVANNAESFGIRISWEGTPCPQDARIGIPNRASKSPEDEESILRTSGMGMNIIRTLFDRVDWDVSGMSMEIWMQKSSPDGPTTTS